MTKLVEASKDFEVVVNPVVTVLETELVLDGIEVVVVLKTLPVVDGIEVVVDDAGQVPPGTIKICPSRS